MLGIFCAKGGCEVSQRKGVKCESESNKTWYQKRSNNHKRVERFTSWVVEIESQRLNWDEMVEVFKEKKREKKKNKAQIHLGSNYCNNIRVEHHIAGLKKE